MNLVKSVVKFLSDTKPVSNADELEQGRAGAEGFVRIGEDGPLISPVRGQHCVAFYYKAFYLTGSRQGQMMPRNLRNEEVYHSFDVELDDGTKIHVSPKKTDKFDSDDHKELSGLGYQGFKATEDLVLPGMRVRVFGNAKKEDEKWSLSYNKLEVVDYTPPPTAQKKKHKKKKKQKPKKKH